MLGHISVVYEKDMKDMKWTKEEQRAIVKPFNLEKITVRLKNIVVYTNHMNYVAGWEVELVDGDYIREVWCFCSGRYNS